MLKKLQVLALVAVFALGFGFFNHSTAHAVECSDGTTASDLSSCPESQADLCSDPNAQNLCAPAEQLIVNENSVATNTEIASGSVDAPPTEIIADASTASDHLADLQAPESLWPMYLSLGALAFAILLIMILNLCGRHRS